MLVERAAVQVGGGADGLEIGDAMPMTPRLAGST